MGARMTCCDSENGILEDRLLSVKMQAVMSDAVPCCACAEGDDASQRHDPDAERRPVFVDAVQVPLGGHAPEAPEASAHTKGDEQPRLFAPGGAMSAVNPNEPRHEDDYESEEPEQQPFVCPAPVLAEASKASEDDQKQSDESAKGELNRPEEVQHPAETVREEPQEQPEFLYHDVQGHQPRDLLEAEGAHEQEDATAQSAAVPAAPPAGAEPRSGPAEFVVILYRAGLPKEDASLGLDLRAKSNPPALYIRAVKPGLVQQWNRENLDCQVCDGDKILSVNGQDTASGMVKALHKDQVVELRLARSLS